MTTLDLNPAVLIALVSSIMGAIIGVVAAGRLFSTKTFRPDNAVQLLRQGRVEEWNEIRVLHPGWRPNLEKVDLSRKSLPYANFSDSSLKGANFSHAELVGCNFSNAMLEGVDFSNSSLKDASFENAVLTGIDLSSANLDRIIFADAQNIPEILEASATRVSKPSTYLSLEYLSHKTTGPEEVRRLLHEASPRELENIVAELFLRQGYQVEVTPQTRDGGYDLLVSRDEPLRGKLTFAVEVKKYRQGKTIGISPVRSLLGVVHALQLDGGIVVATNAFSTGAIALASDSSPISLIDENRLVELLVSLDR